MGELIDRILDEFKDINYAYNDCTKVDTLKSMLSDAVEVVRCGECKHVSVDRYVDGNNPCLSCKELDVNVDCDWFCADGEREVQV